MMNPCTFVSIYKLPNNLTDGYCFGGGILISFLNVDWFNAMNSEGREGLIRFVKTKRYYNRYARFLVIGDSSEFTFTIEAEDDPNIEPAPEKD